MFGLRLRGASHLCPLRSRRSQPSVRARAVAVIEAAHPGASERPSILAPPQRGRGAKHHGAGCCWLTRGAHIGRAPHVAEKKGSDYRQTRSRADVLADTPAWRACAPVPHPVPLVLVPALRPTARCVVGGRPAVEDPPPCLSAVRPSGRADGPVSITTILPTNYSWSARFPCPDAKLPQP